MNEDDKHIWIGTRWGKGGVKRRVLFPAEAPRIDKRTLLYDRGHTLQSNEEKKAYEEAVRKDILLALDDFARLGRPAAARIRDRITQKLEDGSDESLFLLIQQEMATLQEKKPDRDDLYEGLSEVRHRLIDHAEIAGVLTSLEKQVDKLQKGDWEIATEEVGKIRTKSHERRATRITERSNRTSPHFGGICTAWVEGVKKQMTHAELVARSKLEERHGDAAEAVRLKKEAEEIAEGDLKFLSWKGTDGSLVQSAYRYFERERINGERRLPETKEEQLKFVRAHLHRIEKSGLSCADINISSKVSMLEGFLPEMDQKVAAEVRTRIAIYESSVQIRNAAGYISSENAARASHRLVIGAAAKNAVNQTIEGRGLRRETVRVFKGNEMEGLDTAGAWDLLQDANYFYPKILKEVNESILAGMSGLRPAERRRAYEILEGIKFDRTKLEEGYVPDVEADEKLTQGDRTWLMSKLTEEQLAAFHPIESYQLRDDEITQGKVLVCYYSDPDEVRKEAVREHLAAKLGGGSNAKKALELAERFAVGSLETSVWNRTAMFGNDELAEVVGRQGWIAGRLAPGKVVGPLVTQGLIKGYGTSWIRMHRKGGYEADNVDQPLYSRDIDVNSIGAASWETHCGLALTRYHLLSQLLLDESPAPMEGDNFVRSLEFFKLRGPWFIAADPSGKRQMRVKYLLGLVDIACAKPRLGWDQSNIDELGVVVTDENFSEDENLPEEERSFICKDDWEEILSQLDVTERMKGNAAWRGRREVANRISRRRR
jgi:hypothetical protein